jgi:integrase
VYNFPISYTQNQSAFMSNIETFDFIKTLPKRTSSRHTQRAYYRWVDQYLVDLADMKPTRGDARITRMQHLPIHTILPLLLPDTLDTWLISLVELSHSRQGIDQARAAIVTLGELMAQEGLISDELFAKLKYVSSPPIELSKRENTLLTQNQLIQLMNASRDKSTSNNQLLRNSVAMTMLCTMALRREELSVAKWGDLQRQGERIFLNIRNDGGAVEVPSKLLKSLTYWRDAIGEPAGDSPLIRRIWKGGRIAKAGLSSDGIWLIVKDAANAANLGHVTPDDLRRSVAGGLRDAGHSISEISQLLRHKNLIITERYLKRIPIQKDN